MDLGEQGGWDISTPLPTQESDITITLYAIFSDRILKNKERGIPYALQNSCDFRGHR
jgi:hypothetical protein